nr:hypothetical protein GCM10020241_60140 [Streptoalloteichus tenebrarius]
MVGPGAIAASATATTKPASDDRVTRGSIARRRARGVAPIRATSLGEKRETGGRPATAGGPEQPRWVIRGVHAASIRRIGAAALGRSGVSPGRRDR